MKVGAMQVRNFGRGGQRAVRAEVRNGSDVFVNFNGDWEYYRVMSGIEMFSGYVTSPMQRAVLDLAFRVLVEAV